MGCGSESGRQGAQYIRDRLKGDKSGIVDIFPIVKTFRDTSPFGVEERRLEFCDSKDLPAPTCTRTACDPEAEGLRRHWTSADASNFISSGFPVGGTHDPFDQCGRS